MNLDKRQRLLAFVAIAAVALFMADKLLISPLTKSWKARATRIAALREQVREGTETLKREKALTEQWAQMKHNVLNPVKSEAESQMLKAFGRWSDDTDVAVSSIRPQWKESDAGYKTLECRADVSGGLPAITRFLYQIEKDEMGVKVDSMELQSRDTEGSQLTLVVQVSGLLLNPPKGGSQ